MITNELNIGLIEAAKEKMPTMGVKTKPTRLRWVTILQQADIQ